MSEELSQREKMMSACVGSALVSFSMTPLDVVKIRLQSQTRHSSTCSYFLYSNGLGDHLCQRVVNGDALRKDICSCRWYNRPKYFNGTLDAFVKISRAEGISSLWSGLSPTLVLSLPTTVIYFLTYESLRMKFISRNTFSNDNVSSGVAGGIARIWAVTLVSPLELVRTKMQSQKMSFSEVRHAIFSLIKNSGPLSLWKGLTATMFRDVPFSSLYWPTYETVKHHLCKENRPPRFVDNLISGGIAGGLSSALTTPFDVIKTKRQIELGTKHTTNFAVAQRIVSENGFKGLLAGLTPRVMKVSPACAIMISSYEYCKSFFLSRHNKS
ncbi:mitochondrial glutathione transporter SLC25A40 [Lepeophtheirus salmonis]|uniref:Solute carrier family 25 member 40 n=2 Tax=Lepeophtheirus salmonis TaxID=72036 RepID=C1BVD3_LEPSM|nr:solute carrier family 25 member 40-like [Lepeophtheirus salmonis]XP_040580183.1 solute carrier family 25 member 40-like [Lepeophtheirus salmonis]ACO12986.1 Solute carrier family 25 member 40 [Lepeophtheirus salmonis]